MHLRPAAAACEFAYSRILPHTFGQLLDQLADDVAQAMGLLLSHDVARDPARVLDVLLAIEDFEDRIRLLAFRIPQVDRKDQRVAPRVILEDHLGWRV